MNRPFDEERISAYLDDELSDDERRDVERLLAERPEAQRLLDELRGLRDGLQALPAYRLREDFSAAVLRRAEREMLRAPAEETPVPQKTVADRPAEVPSAAVRPAEQQRRDWRRPAAWSLLAVAASLLLMFVDRLRQERPEVALNRAPGRDAAAAPDEADDHAKDQRDAPLEKQKRDATDKLLETDADRFAARTETFAKPGPPAVTAPAPVMTKAGPPATPPGNDVATAGASPSPAHMAVMNTVPPNAPLGKAAEGAAVTNGTITAANAQLGQALGGGVGGAASQQLAGFGAQAGGGYGVDMTPLIAANDRKRALTLVNEYEATKREVADESRQAAAFSRRLQQQALPQQRDQVVLRQPVFDRLDAATDQLLIVQCDVTPEALERGLAPIFAREQIADLTVLQAAALESNRLQAAARDGQAQAAAAGLKSQVAAAAERNEAAAKKAETQTLTDGDAAKAAAGGEEFVYVVADAKQIEATLDALRRQSEYFVNVQVEPAAADARQQAWRSYSRGNWNQVGKLADAAPTPTAAPGSSVQKAIPTDGTTPVAGAPATTPVPAPSQPVAVAQPGFAYGDYRTATPLSRAQRLSSVELSDPAMQENLQLSARGAGRREAVTPPPGEARANVAAPGAPPSGGVGGGGAGNAAKTAGTPAAAGSAIPTGPTDITAGAAAQPQSRPEPAKNSDDAERTRELDARNQVAEPSVDRKSLAEDKELETTWYGVPPNYHEVLFIFRVVNRPTAAAKPAAEAAPNAGPAPAKQ